MSMKSIADRMKELITILDKASSAYYQGKDEIISNFEYDRLYDELERLENESGIVLAGSPTTTVGYEVASELPKERHGYDVLSLDKTKDVTVLESWLGDMKGVLSWKLDGLTVVVTYENGKLVKAVTRGNGEVGEVITANAKTFVNLPLSVPYTGRFVLRGEALIKYSDFEKINSEIENPDEKYKNPRNLCSGSVRQLDSSITAKRRVYFLVYSVLDSEVEFETISSQLDWVSKQGFEVVGHSIVDRNTLADEVALYTSRVSENDFPADGLVLAYDDIAYGKSLGRTAKFPRHSIAFKWEDETAETVLKEIEWSASRTGLINPVAVFEPVTLEGTTVSRASVHNISIVEQLRLGIGDRLLVYKANMIIPQIADNLTESGTLVIPDECPVCGGHLEIRQENGTKTLVCPNKYCLAKQIKTFTHFVSREAMNIDGLSEATIEKFIAKKIIKKRVDFYHLSDYRDIITEMEGFGEKSYNNLIRSVDDSRKVRIENFVYSLAIPGVGLSTARLICRKFDNNLDKAMNSGYDELVEIDGIGDVLAKEWVRYMSDENNRAEINDILKEIDIIIPKEEESSQNLLGITVVITGSLNMFSNRNELKKVIEQNGGKVTGSVTGNTDYLINNDVASGSSKNRKAHELGVKIISEADFVNEFGLV